MVRDIRIAVSFLNNPKRIKLIKRLGRGATDYLVNLWISVALNKPTGTLTGWSAEDIEIVAAWDRAEGEFVQALIQEKLLDVLEDGTFKVHDWEEHNGYVSSFEERSKRARKAAYIKNYGKAEGNKRYENYLKNKEATTANTSETRTETGTSEQKAPVQEVPVIEKSNPDAVEVLEYYESKTIALNFKHKRIATQNISHWLKSYPKEQLISAAEVYFNTCEQAGTSKQYIKRANNFYAYEGENRGYFIPYLKTISKDNKTELTIEAVRCCESFTPHGDCKSLRGTLDFCELCIALTDRLLTKEEINKLNKERKNYVGTA